jgi:hypothetical protein
LVISCDVTIGEIHAIVGADVAVTATGESDEVTNVLRLVFWDVAYSVAFTSDYLDSILVVGVGWVWFQGGSELAKVFIYMFAVRDACNGKFEIVTYALFLWPDADVVSFVLDAEIAEPFHLRGVDGLTLGRLLLMSGCILLFTGVVRIGQHVSFVWLFVWVEMSQSVSHQNGGYNEKK